jgi:hypothetical protein
MRLVIGCIDRGAAEQNDLGVNFNIVSANLLLGIASALWTG